MEWHYEVDASWLMARKKFLCASEIGGLAESWLAYQESVKKAETDKRYKPASKKADFESKCRQIWLDKIGRTVDLTTTVTQRRGHCLEPEALEVFMENTGLPVYHWDNVIVTDGTGLAVSPDGMNVHPPNELIAFKNFYELKHGYEVKCFLKERYEKHYRLQNKFDIDKEIFHQVAMQIMVCGLEDCTLIFFNPDLEEYCMRTFTFTREEVLPFFNLYRTVAEEYKKYIEGYKQTLPPCEFKLLHSEGDLYREFNW